MINRMKAYVTKQTGQALVLAVLTFTGLVGVTGLVIDGGMLYMTHTSMQKTANAAVLSGAQELMAETDEDVRNIVDDILDSHKELDSLSELNVTLKERVAIRLEKSTSLYFGAVLGMKSVDIHVTAVARTGTMGTAAGVAPLGIDESIPLNYGVEYELKVDEEDVDTGNFGILALEGTGAATYKETLLHGSENQISVGDILDTQTGNVAGPTKEAVDELVASCDDRYDRSCRRVILIPTYTPHDHTQNQLKHVEVTGFAYFYITESVDDDKTIKGEFIERVGTGYEDEHAKESGAFIIKLTE